MWACQKKIKFNGLEISEEISLGQRVKSFKVMIYADGGWKEIASSATIGHKRILHFQECFADRIRIIFTGSLATPVLRELKLFDSPF